MIIQSPYSDAVPASLARGTMTLDRASYRLMYLGHGVDLTNAELVFMARLAKDGSVPNEPRLAFRQAQKVSLSRLRGKLSAAGWPDPIKTVYGKGYKARWRVEIVDGGQPPLVIPGAFRAGVLRILLASGEDCFVEQVLMAVRGLGAKGAQ